jgi:hypothetical protein
MVAIVGWIVAAVGWITVAAAAPMIADNRPRMDLGRYEVDSQI